MNRKVALLTWKDLPDHYESRFEPEKSYLEVGLYRLTDPNKPRLGVSAEEAMVVQIKDARVLAMRHLDDSASLSNTLNAWTEKYCGVNAGGVMGVSRMAQFRVQHEEVILRECFLVKE